MSSLKKELVIDFELYKQEKLQSHIQGYCDATLDCQRILEQVSRGQRDVATLVEDNSEIVNFVKLSVELWDKKGKSNSSLVSTAPEMLEVLERVEKHFSITSVGALHNPQVDELRAAIGFVIKKAKGEK